MFTLVKLFFLIFVVKTFADRCITPANERGRCVDVNQCYTAIERNKSEAALSEYILTSLCGGTAREPMVCCRRASIITTPGLSNPVIKPTVSFSEAESKLMKLSDRRYCGYQHSDDYFHSHNDTDINEFPWMAFLLFQNKFGKPIDDIRCTGTVINSRYVLTAASCVAYGDDFKVAAARLGEYSINNKTDCKTSTFYHECSEPAEDYEVEKVILHSEFKIQPLLNDIALIKLRAQIRYTDTIRPICLPIPGITLSKPEDILMTSGWGKENINGEIADKKKKITTKRVTNAECQTVYNKTEMYVTENHICAKETTSNIDLSCSGDGGAPLMCSERLQWHQEGIFSYGIGCHSGYPGVYTKVVNYLQWIADNIQDLENI